MAPPAHSFILVDDSTNLAKSGPVSLEFSLLDGQIVVAVKHVKHSRHAVIPRVYLFDHTTSDLREIPVPLPSNIEELPDGARLAVPELAELQVSGALLAPDGYEFQGRSRRASLVTDIFGGSRSRSNVTIAKDGAVVRVRLRASRTWYADVQFLGWVVN